MLAPKAALLSTSLLLSVVFLTPDAWAQALPADAGTAGVGDENANDDILVFGRAEPQIGIAFASSEGRVGRADFETRPLLRVGELLEVVPGLIATQHSGPGKANQFFLRGFNLDHGTDFAGFFDGVPLNLRTHGHGQGYLDLNPIIPETVEFVDFRKGPYRADVGDFATAGAGFFRTYDELPSRASVEFGTGNFIRGLVLSSSKVGNSKLLLAGEVRFDDGRFIKDDNLEFFNFFGKLTSPLAGGTLRTSFTFYDVSYDSTDQIPLRLIESGALNRRGFVDDDLGGSTTRVGLTTNFSSDSENPLNALAYVYYYDFNLFSNFTYFLDDPVNGDEFEQQDKRTVFGGRVDKSFNFGIANLLVGADTRFDIINDVGLFNTAGRRRFNTVRQDDVNVSSGGVFSELVVKPVEGLRILLGLRGDLYNFDVSSDNPLNSGSRTDGILNPKASIAYKPTESLEFYANYGQGFHSNDGRGTTITVDPKTGDPADTVTPLVRGRGGEVGFRTTFLPGLNFTATAWYLNLDSELLFIGDGGTTEPQGRSKRRGLEFALFYQPVNWLTLDAEYTTSRARLSDLPEGEDRIPGAIEETITGGATVAFGSFSATARVRHFGSFALIEDNSTRSEPTTLVNLGFKYKIGAFDFGVDVLNLFNSKDADITYFYASRLPGEPDEGIEDIHLHPVERRQVRVSATLRF